MAEQLKFNYASAYLKQQIIKGKWLLHKQAAIGQMGMAIDFINGNSIIEGDQEEPEITQPYTVKLKSQNSFEQSKNISIIPINGSLMKYDYCGAPGMQSIGKRIKLAEESDSVAGILLHIDSPGGTVDGTEELGNVIKNCSKPILAYGDGLVASAGYWLASSADKVIAKDNTTEIGSIGVVLSFASNKKALEEQGWEFHDIFADQSNEKWKEMTDAEKGDYSTIREWTLNPLAEEFQNTVKNNRANINDKALHGRVFLAKKAKKLGLIDGIGNFDFAIKELNKLINNKNIMSTETEKKVVEMTVPADEKGFFDKLVNHFKPEVKDISEETKAEYNNKLNTANEKIKELEAELSEYKAKVETLENEKIDLNASKLELENTLVEKEEANKSLLIDKEEVKTKLTKKVIESSNVEVVDDKLKIGELSEEEAAWVKELESFKDLC